MDPVTLGAASAAASKKYSRSLLNTYCVMGDSFASKNRTSTGTPGSPGYVDYYDASGGFLPWTMAWLNARMIEKGNYGVSGTRSDQWISGGQVASVVAVKPGWCIVTAPTNDRAQNVTLATTQGYMTTIFDTLRAAGVRVIALGLTPASGASALSAGQIAYTVQYNYWLKTLQMSRVGFVAVDPFNSLVLGSSATAGAWIALTAQWTTDGLHPANHSVARMGKLIANALDPLVPYVDLRPLGGLDTAATGVANACLNSNPGMGSTAGTIGKTGTGSVASFWSVTSSDGANFAGTVTASKVTATDQTDNPWQQIAVTTAASAVRLQQTGLTTGYTAGTTTARAECEIDTDADLSSVSRISLSAWAVISGGSIESRWAYQPTAGDYPATNRLTVDYRGRYPVLVTPVMTVPASTTSMNIYLDFTGLGTIRVRNMALRINPPT